MAQIFGRDRIAGISSAPPERRQAFLQQSKARGLSYVYGHFRYSDAAPFYEDANYLIALRNPVHRILSHYFMLLRREPKTALAEECVAAGQDGFTLFHRSLVVRRKQDNLMCRYICDEPDHSAAIEGLSRYSLVWDAERTDEAWRRLHLAECGFEPKALERRNAAPVRHDYDGFLTAAQTEELEEVNREDLLLYQWFQRQMIA